MDMRIYEKKHLTATGSVYSGQCVLRYLTLNKTDTGTVAISDMTDDSSPIATIQDSAPEGTYRYDCVMGLGIYVTLGGSQDVTVIYERL
jgi:hypothetical protein